ncbi:hypothetical protein DFR86_02555 [Acidianus sulfidivorans JP7]|uniref:Nucleotide pyrophosphatase n=1 Tax=Acidianus sulfidivorans JP7 TaxID=619593 RepID=A0A2U9IKH8_9CREN|nr:hypothetical protein [Acidianus sulfidivorans]AWR96538.1 hypothetical protein DFR86_02555 [Acidianus sulfidivorans JP7]
MKPLLLGVDGLSYSSFMKCNPRFLLTLFSTTFRGVVVNRKPQHPSSSWLSVLEMTEVKDNKFIKVDETPRLIRETNAVAINLPISNPTYGELSLPYNDGVSAKEEIDKVVSYILDELEDRPVIADISALDRLLHNSQANKCELYKEIDDAVKKILHKADEFILFSPYGEPKSDQLCDHEEYGVYIASIPRPNEHDVVKLPEIGMLFKRAVTQS